MYLQNENEVVDRFAPQVEEVLRRPLVVFIELDLLDDVGVFEDPEQDFLRDLERTEQADLWDTMRREKIYLKQQEVVAGFRLSLTPPGFISS